MTRPDGGPLLPLRPRVFAILLLLAERPRHGYGIMRELREAPSERWPPGPATLYRTLRAMEREGLIGPAEVSEPESEGPPRRYYQLTPHGRRTAGAEAARMAALVAQARAGALLPA